MLCFGKGKKEKSGRVREKSKTSNFLGGFVFGA